MRTNALFISISLYVVACFLGGCSSKPANSASAMEGDALFPIHALVADGKDKSVNNLVIPLNENYLQSYSGTSSQPVSFAKDGKEFMAGFNSQLNTCDVLNLTDKRIAYQIPLRKEGPDRVGIPAGIQYYKGNFVFEASDSYRLVDSLGHVIAFCPKAPLSDFCPGYRSFKPNQEVLFMRYKFFAFDRESGTVAVTFYPPEINAEPVTHPLIIGLMKIESGEMEKIEIPYPDCFSKRDRWGIMNDMNVCFHQGSLILNFGGSSDIYVYQRSTKNLNRYTIPSGYVDNLIVPKSTKTENENKTSINAGYYFPLQYDPYRDVFWRLQEGPLREEGGDYKRLYSLTCISTDFKEYKEILLPDGLNLYPQLLIGKEKLWLPYGEGMAEDDLWLFEIDMAGSRK